MTLKVSFAGEGSLLPEVSTAKTLSVCRPRVRRLVVKGEVQGRGLRRSSLQRKVEPASFALKRKVGVRSLVLLGGRFLNVVFGGVVSGGTHACSVGVVELFLGDGVPSAKSLALLSVSSAASSSVGQAAEMLRITLCPALRPPESCRTGVPTGDGFPCGGALAPIETQSMPSGVGVRWFR